MNSIIRMASRVVARPILERASFVSKASTTTPIRFGLTLNKRYAHNQMLTYDYVRERVLMTLCLFDKVDPDKLTLDSHFVNDLGLDSLDHVEIIMHIEGEFLFDIPDKDAEKLVTPRDILMYITDHEEAYEELQKISDHDHHDHGHEHVHYTLQGLKLPTHNHDHGHGHGKEPTHQQTRGFCSLATMSRRNMARSSGPNSYIPTSFGARPPKEIKIESIQERVMKICSKYDKIDSSKLELASHFVQDLGLDSLDHVEIMMELEDEFGLEIPDQEAEKLMRPVEIARFIFKEEEKRAMQPADRPF